MIFEQKEPTTIAFDTQFGSNANTFEDISPTLKASQQPPSFLESTVYPIDDARELEKHQNGTGIGAEGAPAYTLDRQQAPAVVFNIFGGNPRPDRPEGGFYVNETEKSKTLDSSSGLNPSANQGGTAIVEQSVVRRLTPIECERLQGFPDNWTDGQADSNRYKQMGNAVAVPVVEWIISRMVGEE